MDSENLQSVSELLFVYFAVFQELKINLNILHHRHWESFLCVCQSEKRKGKGCVRANTVDTSCVQCMCLCRVTVTERCVCQNLINCWVAFKASVYPQLSVKTSSSLCSFSANMCILFSSHHKFRFSAFWCIFLKKKKKYLYAGLCTCAGLWAVVSVHQGLVGFMTAGWERAGDQMLRLCW